MTVTGRAAITVKTKDLTLVEAVQHESSQRLSIIDIQLLPNRLLGDYETDLERPTKIVIT